MKIRSLELESTVLDHTKFPDSGMTEVAVAGRSNVGKSSLLNALFNRGYNLFTMSDARAAEALQHYLKVCRDDPTQAAHRPEAEKMLRGLQAGPGAGR